MNLLYSGAIGVTCCEQGGLLYAFLTHDIIRRVNFMEGSALVFQYDRINIEI